MSTEASNRNLPGGTVTFLFTDIQGSTELLKQLGESYATLLADQRGILRTVFEKWDGREIDTQGDAFFASFPRATQAVAAVVEIQRALANHDWPGGAEVCVRMGLHTGEPWLVEEGYVGMDVHRAARIAHVGHGGQVLLSETTAPLVQDELPEGVALLDLGRHRLKDLRRPEHIHQLVIDGLPSKFSPLNSLEVISSPGELEAEVAVRPPRQVGPSPYRGLAAFQEQDAQFFFGRETFTAQLAEAVQQHSLVAVVVGSSGSGKSSAVFAGLLPQLRGDDGWLVVPLRPGEAPFHALASALLPYLEPGLDETDRLLASQKMADGLSAGEVTLFHTVNRVLENSGTSSRLLLFLDQFEELYTLCPDPDTRQAFTDELLAAVQTGTNRRPNPLSILLTLRADFMGQALTNRPFADAMQEGSLLLGPMNRDELRTAIEKPAELQGAAFEPGLVPRILDDVGEEPGNLPLLEFALTLLWDQMEAGWMTHEVYHQIGRVEGALARYADQIYSELTQQEQEGARRAFVQLVQPGQGTEDTRRVARRADLVGLDWGLIQHLADQRLVVTGLDEAGNETVEVVHEALIRGWGQLREWMAADRDFRNWQEGLRVALRGWENSGRDEGALLRGVPLAQAEEWLETRGDQISDAEREYIQASLAEQRARAEAEIARQEHERALEQRSIRRLRVIVAVLVIASIIGITLTLAVFNQSRIARQNESLAEQNAATATIAQGQALFQAATAESERSRAEGEAEARATQQAIAEDQAAESFSRELAAAALNNLDEDPELSIMLALQGLEASRTNEAVDALRQAILSSRVRRTMDTADRSGFVTYNPDGTRLLTSGEAGAMIWDATSGELLHTLPIDIFVSRTDFSLDGQLAITSNDDGTVSAWDVESGDEVLTFQAQDGWVQHAVLNPEGTILATTGGEGTAKLWDWGASLAVGEGVLLQTLTGHTDAVNYASFSPDGARLATASSDDSVWVWDVATGRELLILEAEATDVTFSPDGGYLVTGSNFGTLDVWDAQDGRKLSSTSAHGGDNIQNVIFSPDGEQLLTSSNDGTGRIWRFDPAGLEELLVLAGHDSWTLISDFSPDGRYVATSSIDGTTRIWDITPSGSQELGAFAEHEGRNSQVIFSPDDSRLFTAGFGGWVRAIDPESGEEFLSVEAHQDLILGLALSPDGKLLTTASEDGTVKILASETGEEILKLEAHEVQDSGFFHGAMAVDFSPDGLRLVTTGNDGLAKVWDTSTGDELFVLSGHEGGVNGVDFSPDGTLIATSSSDNTTRIWDAVDGTHLYTLATERGEKYGVHFSPDGARLATGDSLGQLEIWEIPADPWNAPEVISEPLLTVSTNTGWSGNLEYSPDGTQIAIPGTSGIVDVRDAETGELLQSFVHPSGAMSVSFSSDGKHLATGGFDGITRVFTLDVDELVELGKSRLTRSLTTEECQTYLHLEACPKE